MADITLKTFSDYDCTIGRLWCGSFQCFTLELPYLNNSVNISCIPAGVYDYEKRISPKNGHVIELKNVPSRSYIQIHAGNYTRQIQGCVLVGDSIGFLDSDTIPDVLHSKATLEHLLSIAPDSGKIEVKRSGLTN